MNKILKSQSTISYIAFVAITVLAFKNAPVFKELSFPSLIGPSLENWYYYLVLSSQYLISFISVIAIEIAVLVFVYRGEKKESIAFAVFSFLCSMYYFNQFRLSVDTIPENIMQIAISSIFPFIVVRFSHLYKDSELDKNSLMEQISSLKQEIKKEKLEITRLNQVIKDKTLEFNNVLENLSSEEERNFSIKQELTNLKLELEEEKLENKNITLELTSLKQEKKEREDRLSCSMCGAGPFETVQALTGHKRKCKQC